MSLTCMDIAYYASIKWGEAFAIDPRSRKYPPSKFLKKMGAEIQQQTTFQNFLVKPIKIVGKISIFLVS